jgi:hypothetical protein
LSAASDRASAMTGAIANITGGSLVGQRRLGFLPQQPAQLGCALDPGGGKARRER